MNSKYLLSSLVLIIAVSLVVSLSGCSQNSADNADSITADCRYPVNKLEISVSPARCQQLSNDCEMFYVKITSPQISSLISSGKYPCTEGIGSTAPCVVPDAHGWSRLFCYNVAECSKGTTTDLGVSFGGAMMDSSIKITDTVDYCPITKEGTPLGKCVSSITKQCDPDATLTLLVN